MQNEGPPLERLLQRVAQTPPEFLGEPRHGSKGSIDVRAVVADLCRVLGFEPALDGLEDLTRGAERNALGSTLLLCWLFADDWFRERPWSKDRLLWALVHGARELAEHTPHRKFLEDVERREELVRHSLAQVGLRPLGESSAQAEDRLTSLSAAERARVLKAARAAEERARAVREALARKAAQESADKWSRE